MNSSSTNCTTRFEEWIVGNEPETSPERLSLRQAIDGENCGPYTGSKGPNGTFLLEGPDGMTLVLATEKARQEFARLVDEQYEPHADLGWEEGAAYDHALERG